MTDPGFPAGRTPLVFTFGFIDGVPLGVTPTPYFAQLNREKVVIVVAARSANEST